jgi:hypothetical protein
MALWLLTTDEMGHPSASRCGIPLEKGSGKISTEFLRRLDGHATRWDHPTMKLIADQKRRVVLPKPAEPGDVFEVIESGDRLVLVKLVRAKAGRPPVAPIPADPRLLKGIDLDEPAFAPISDESPA